MALSAFDQELLSLISEYDIIWREDASMDTGFWVDAAFQQVVLILSIDCSERFPNEYLFFAYVKQRWEELLTWRYNHYKILRIRLASTTIVDCNSASQIME
ncbi:uncharacterized protein [Fopius arisanus]|uniref:Uncharacterized protein isoform X2 n=1 Tax=Fopius arisanus TaxID=64838 RepID=A0A9R1THI5_9HYME|nr:PREDICTED: uncharacterized protein LOC105270255 isoform X2 [Fopius arisanus]